MRVFGMIMELEQLKKRKIIILLLFLLWGGITTLSIYMTLYLQVKKLTVLTSSKKPTYYYEGRCCLCSLLNIVVIAIQYFTVEIFIGL